MPAYQLVSYLLVSWRNDFIPGYEKPVLFGKTVTADGFTNRTKDMQRLKANFTNPVNTIINQNAMLYMRDTENLSTPQFNFLKALADGVKTNFSSKQIISHYQLGTSANVLKIKKALVQKELIDDAGITIAFLDPAYELWFQKNIQAI